MKSHNHKVQIKTLDNPKKSITSTLRSAQKYSVPVMLNDFNIKNDNLIQQNEYKLDMKDKSNTDSMNFLEFSKCILGIDAGIDGLNFLDFDSMNNTEPTMNMNFTECDEITSIENIKRYLNESSGNFNNLTI